VRIVGLYSFNGGAENVQKNYPDLLVEVKQVIAGVNAEDHKTKKSEEKTMLGKMLYSPSSLNGAFKEQFQVHGWASLRVKCEYPTEYYIDGYVPTRKKHQRKSEFREMDFIKRKLGVEVQFGKYSFMVYNVAAKMTIFSNLGFINAGIEIVPVKQLVHDMSTGVSYFEQFIWDLKNRGVSDIDIPVLIIGIDS